MGKASHCVLELLKTNRLLVFCFDILLDVLPKPLNLVAIYPEGLLDTLLRNVAVPIGINLLEGLFEVDFAQKLFFVGCCRYKLVVVYHPIAVNIHFFE